jgi:magnesium chelatase family protein
MSRVHGAALYGVEGVAVEVEVRISSQLPRIDIVGLPEAAVRESAARVRAAVGSIGASFPDRRVTVSLAPASLRKSGAGLDLPIAIGILGAAGSLGEACLDGLALLGELALDGRLRPVRGALALALAVRDAGCRRLIVPRGSAAEAALAPNLEVLACEGLAEVALHLREGAPLPRAVPAELGGEPCGLPDLCEVRGQERAKAALEAAAAGGHALLLRGAPGCGKTMLAQRMRSLLPPLDFDEALEVTRVHGAAGLIREGAPIAAQRPFRAPHHTASTAGLLGGGSPPRPGEISLAHRGVLFLDELPEFDRRSLEALRQVLEQRHVVVSRARGTCRFPADFQLVAAANPCPCGWLRSGQRDCRCDEGVIARYRTRLSGPLLDRIDLHVNVPAVPWSELDAARPGEGSGSVRERVVAARRVQRQRGAAAGIRVNAEIPDGCLDELVAATPDARCLLGRAVEKLGLSARAARRVLKLARTLADLAGEAKTGPHAVAEALAFRGDPEGGGAHG